VVESRIFRFIFTLGELAMDGAATMSEIVETFRTPVRILLPKLLKSREDWKTKSHQRKAKLRSASTKIRDLSASRDKWRQRTERLEEENRQLQEQLEQAQRDGEQTRAALTELEEAKKK
jgi:chromosome segregation ATPase